MTFKGIVTRNHSLKFYNNKHLRISFGESNNNPDTFPLTAIDGGYTDWIESCECSVRCGGGEQILTRTCTNPPPSDGGKNCRELGPAEKIVSCNEQDCRKYF